MSRITRAWPWGALGVAAAVVVLLAVARPWRGAGTVGDDAAMEVGAGRESLPPPSTPPPPLVHPEDVKWLSDATYVDGGGRMVSRYDSDGDGLADADELLLYGTLRCDARTRADAPRIDLKPPGSRVFHSTRTPEGDRFREPAKRALRPEEDTDGDGLPDAWKQHWFGHLGASTQGEPSHFRDPGAERLGPSATGGTVPGGPWDDPDGDGFPNLVEWYRGTSPLEPDMLDPSMKPEELEDLPLPGTPWDIPWDIHCRRFWAIQDRLAAERGEGGD